jgi:hypothetical protein
LLNPDAHARELRLFDKGRSAYRFVSNQPHCALASGGPGVWQAATDREDVATLLNGMPLPRLHPSSLADGDSIQIGYGGPELAIAIL